MKTPLSIIRTRCNYSQSLAAQAVGVSRQMFSVWESGAKAIPPARLEQLAQLFGVHVDLLSQQDLEAVEHFCDRPMFSHVVQGRQVLSFAPTGHGRIYLGSPGPSRPEERGMTVLNRKNRSLQALERHLTLKPGSQADDLPQLEAAVSALDCFGRLVNLSAQLEPDAALRTLSLLGDHLELLAAALGVSKKTGEFSPAELHQVQLLRVKWNRNTRDALDRRRQETLPSSPDDRDAFMDRLLACYQQAKYDGWSQVELQWRLNQLFHEVDADEAD